jgi:WhiB family transcriptional regulator, redox-sensing transcriptional regulator
MADFRHRAACRDADPELFFPLGTGPLARAQFRRAKNVCQRCEVQDPCLGWALSSGQQEGVWGGLDPDERRALRQRDARREMAPKPRAW